jgi:hypothetical protein
MEGVMVLETARVVIPGRKVVSQKLMISNCLQRPSVVDKWL